MLKNLLTAKKVEIIFIKIPVMISAIPSRINRLMLSNVNMRKNSFSIRYRSPISSVIAISAARNP
jgi:hypothetical protein